MGRASGYDASIAACAVLDASCILRVPGLHAIRFRLLLVALAPLVGCGHDAAEAIPGLLFTFGRTGLGPGEFSYPRAAALSPDGQLYIVDKAARVQRIAADGAFLLDWRMAEWQAGKPTGLTVASDGRVFVADTHYARVQVFDPNGLPLATFGSFGEGPGQFILPTDVALDADGFIYVSEYGGNDRISKFTPAFEYVMSFAGRDDGEARTERPQSLLVDGDLLWVTDSCRHRVCAFSLTGELRSAFGRNGKATGELHFPYGIDRLSDGTLIVAEFGNNRVQRFTRDGRSLGVWGTAGRRPGELAYPWAVAVGAGDRVYVLDSGNNRVQVLDANRAVWRR